MTERVWVHDRGYTVVHNGHKCSARDCPRPAVAVTLRATARFGRRDWRCEHHIYGRRLHAGRIEVRVSADSPAAERGWVN